MQFCLHVCLLIGRFRIVESTSGSACAYVFESTCFSGGAGVFMEAQVYVCDCLFLCVCERWGPTFCVCVFEQAAQLVICVGFGTLGCNCVGPNANAGVFAISTYSCVCYVLCCLSGEFLNHCWNCVAPVFRSSLPTRSNADHRVVAV